MATYSSRDAIKAATHRAVDGLVPLMGAWHDASKELWTQSDGIPTPDSLERFKQAYGALLEYCARYDVDVHSRLGA